MSECHTAKNRSCSWRIPACAAALVVGFFLFYASDSTKTVIPNNGDCIQYQIIGSVGGIPHQPYPLWCVLTHVASLAPIGEPAFRVTLLAVLFAALAVGGLLVLIVGITRNLFVSIIAAIAFGLSGGHWTTAVVPEVYSLNTFLLVTFFIVLQRWLMVPTRSRTYLLMLLLGFLFSHHQVNIALLPGIAFLAWTRREALSANVTVMRGAAALGIFMIPFTLYLYTYFMDRNPDTYNWLERYGKYLYVAAGNDPGNFDNFFERIRFQMWAGRYHDGFRSPQELVVAAWAWIKQLFSFHFPFLGPFLIIVGFFSSWRRGLEAAFLCLITAGAYVFLALIWSARTVPYSIPVFLLFSIYLAFGLQFVTRGLSRNARFAFLGVYAVMLVSLPILRQATASPLARVFHSEEKIAAIKNSRHRFHHLDARSNRDGETYARAVMRQVPAGSLIFGSWPQTLTLLYYKLVLGELEQVYIEFMLPTHEAVLGRIMAIRPSQVYITSDPQYYGFETAEVIDIDPAAKLYRVRLDEILPNNDGY